MRLTVGPLPPAVYWRRRAVVLGAAILFLVVLLYSCSGSGNTGANPQSTRSPSAAAAPGPTAPSATGPAATGAAGATGPVAGAAPGGQDGSPTAQAPAGNAAPAADGSCTDAEMSVVPVPVPATARRGETIQLKLKIKNASSRTCSRDVGADMQEIAIRLGAERVWSSDTCGTGRGSAVESFTAGFEREYQVGWNGRDSTKCADGVASGPYPSPGEFQVIGRVGTKLSEPVRLSITG